MMIPTTVSSSSKVNERLREGTTLIFFIFFMLTASLFVVFANQNLT